MTDPTRWDALAKEFLDKHHAEPQSVAHAGFGLTITARQLVEFAAAVEAQTRPTLTVQDRMTLNHIRTLIPMPNWRMYRDELVAIIDRLTTGAPA